MKKLDINEVPKLKPNPLFKGLPASLKDPKRFKKIESELFNMLQSDHKHKTVKGYVTCAWCNKKRELRENRIKALGFKTMGQYLEWRKLMQIIIRGGNLRLR